MNIKRMVAALVATGGIIGFAGCGAAEDSPVVDTQADKGLEVMGDAITYDPNHLVNDGQPITVEYWTWGQAATDPIYQMIQQYEKIHPNVRIDVNVVAWDDYWTKLPLSLKGNKNAPVLFNVHNSYDALIRPHMEPYDIPLEDLETDYTFVDTHVDENGEVKYIDSVINTGAIFYNKDLWAEAGLTEADIPTTWDELIEVAQKLTKFDGDTMVQAGFNINGSYKAAWQGLNYQKGVLMFQEDGHTANYDCETTKENLEFLQSLYDKYQVGAVNFGDDRELSFGNNQTAMIYDWGSYVGTLATNYPDVNYGVFPTPAFSEETPFAYDRYNGESTPGINVHQSDEQKAVAQDFIRFILANDDYMRIASDVLNSFPGKKSLQDDPEILDNPMMAAIAPRLDRLIWPGPTPSTLETSPQIAFENVLQKGQDVDSAVAYSQELIMSDMEDSDFTSMESRYAHYDERKD